MANTVSQLCVRSINRFSKQDQPTKQVWACILALIQVSLLVPDFAELVTNQNKFIIIAQVANVGTFSEAVRI